MKECRLCQKQEVELLIGFGEQPIVHNLLDTPDQPYEKYPFNLGVCKSCGLIQLIDCLAPEVLYENYFTISSWKNQPHVQRLIEVTKQMTGLNEKSKLLEVGCNDGSFLMSLKQHGIDQLTGIEPTKDASSIAIDRGLNVLQTFLTKKNAESSFEKKSFDLIISRQVLEHIIDLADFVQAMEYVLKDDGFLVLEIPDSDWALEYLDYALWEEHVNYFTIHTLKRLLAKHRFRIIHHETTLFSGKALIAIAVKDEKGGEYSAVKENELLKIWNYQRQWEKFQIQLKEYLGFQREVMIYGCGARSCNFVNFTGIGDLVKCFVDDQVEKQHRYIPGCELKCETFNPGLEKGHFLLGVNAENEFSIINKRGLDRSQCSSILPPSNFLPQFWKEMIYDRF